jgi:exodeoxyribonuclease VII large subunit
MRDQHRARTRLPLLAVQLRRASDPADRARSLDHLALALSAHDPRRAQERGYALLEDSQGELITSAQDARAAGHVRIGFADGSVGARIEDET